MDAVTTKPVTLMSLRSAIADGARTAGSSAAETGWGATTPRLRALVEMLGEEAVAEIARKFAEGCQVSLNDMKRAAEHDPARCWAAWRTALPAQPAMSAPTRWRRGHRISSKGWDRWARIRSRRKSWRCSPNWMPCWIGWASGCRLLCPDALFDLPSIGGGDRRTAIMVYRFV
jgi:hypothetical protein